MTSMHDEGRTKQGTSSHLSNIYLQLVIFLCMATCRDRQLPRPVAFCTLLGYGWVRDRNTNASMTQSRRDSLVWAIPAPHTHTHKHTHASSLSSPSGTAHSFNCFQCHPTEDYVSLISLTRTSGLGAIALHNLQCSSGSLMHLLRLLFVL